MMLIGTSRYIDEKRCERCSQRFPPGTEFRWVIIPCGCHCDFCEACFESNRTIFYFHLWSVEDRRQCGARSSKLVRRYVRPALLQTFQMLSGCPYPSGDQQDKEARRREFRQKARRWFRRAA